MGPTGPHYRPTEIQHRLAALLREHYASMVITIGDHAIRVDDPNLRAFIEVRATTDPRSAIRDAIGALLDHAVSIPSVSGVLPRFVVAAPGASTPAVDAFLHALRERFGLVIEYVEANPNLFALPPALAPPNPSATAGQIRRAARC